MLDNLRATVCQSANPTTVKTSHALDYRPPEAMLPSKHAQAPPLLGLDRHDRDEGQLIDNSEPSFFAREFTEVPNTVG